jgi:hypothetical protein
VKLLLHLYPGWWRRRYGAEALDILQGRPITATSLLDLLAGALDAWVNQEMPPSGAGESDAPIAEGGLLMAGNRIRISGASAVSVAAAVGPVLRRNAAAMVAAVVLAIVLAGVAAALTANANLHSWGDVAGSAGLSQGDSVVHFAYGPIGPTSSHTLNGNIVAAAGVAAVASALALMLALIVVSLASFLLFGAPAVLVLIGAAISWGIQLGFGDTTLAQGWFAAAAGVALLALALNTGAALPKYWSRRSGSERRLESRREALASYWALYRALVMPACGVFGIMVFVTVALLATS